MEIGDPPFNKPGTLKKKKNWAKRRGRDEKKKNKGFCRTL